MVKVKICGLTHARDIRYAVESGVDYLGLVFVPTHRHSIAPGIARNILLETKGKVASVGIFVNATLELVKRIVEDCQLDYIQFHGEETPDYCIRARSIRPAMKAFKFGSSVSFDDAAGQMKCYNVDYFILDRHVQGEGSPVRKDFARRLAQSHSVFLAGGFTPENVREVVAFVRPFGVDVSSGIETNGITDRKKMKKFIQEAKL